MQIKGEPKSEYSEKFLQGMVNRMIVSYHKYGKVADAYPKKIDAIASLKKRLELYETDGNTEWLMDVSNFAMIEFMCPRHKLAHFRPTSSDESPGRKFLKEKDFSAKANTKQKDDEHVVAQVYKGREGD